jgi:NADH dehydrogenase
VLGAFDESLSRRAATQLRALGVEVLTGTKVTRIDASGLDCEPGGRIAARTVLWAAGVAASPLGAQLGAPLDRAGRVLVQPDLSVPGHPGIFVVGDLAAVQSDGRPTPGVGAAAKQMGALAARNVLARIAGREGAAFRYRDYGMLATIGRHAAVGSVGGVGGVGGVRMSGLPAWLFWLFWLFVHLFYLVGFRNRVVVFVDWAWSYFTFERSARIVWKE